MGREVSSETRCINMNYDKAPATLRLADPYQTASFDLEMTDDPLSSSVKTLVMH
jgi:hypothetical protein